MSAATSGNTAGLDFAELVRATNCSVVACHRRQLGHILQQYAPALQVQDAVLAPELQLAVDALAGGADENAELLLRDVHFRTEIGGQRTKSSRQAGGAYGREAAIGQKKVSEPDWQRFYPP